MEYLEGRQPATALLPWHIEPTSPTEQGPVYWLDRWERETVVLHKHMIEDGPYNDTGIGTFGDRGHFVTIDGHVVFIKHDGQIEQGTCNPNCVAAAPRLRYVECWQRPQKASKQILARYRFDCRSIVLVL